MSNSDASDEARRLTRKAWWGIAAFFLSFFLAILVGEGLTTAFGYPSLHYKTNPPPNWVRLVSNIGAVAVFITPAVYVIRQGRKAVKSGDTSAKMPMIVAWVIGVGFPVLLLGPMIVAMF